MNKAQLIEALSERLGDKKAAGAAVDGLVDVIVRTVNKGEKVNITGFGVFEKRDRAARLARNPATGEKVLVKKTSVPAFRAGQGFKDVVRGARKLPTVAAATATTAAKTAASRATARVSATATAAKTAAARATGTGKTPDGPREASIARRNPPRDKGKIPRTVWNLCCLGNTVVLVGRHCTRYYQYRTKSNWGSNISLCRGGFCLSLDPRPKRFEMWPGRRPRP